MNKLGHQDSVQSTMTSTVSSFLFDNANNNTSLPSHVVSAVRTLGKSPKRKNPSLLALALMHSDVSNTVIWYTVRRTFLGMLIAVTVFLLMSKKFASLVCFNNLIYCIFFLHSHISFKVSLCADILCCSLFSIAWVPTLIGSFIHSYSLSKKQRLDLLYKDISFSDGLIDSVRQCLRQFLFTMAIYTAIYLFFSSLRQGFVFPNAIDLLMFLSATNIANFLSVRCMQFSPMNLNLSDICCELNANSQIGEFLALSTLSQRCRSVVQSDEQLYSLDMWPKLADHLVFTPDISAQRIKVFCALITRSYKIDSRGVVQLQLGKYLEKLIDLKDSMQYRDCPMSSVDIYCELTKCLQAISFRFGKSLESCDLPAKHLNVMREISLSKH
ncbi:hypothetical protein GJ496_005114 [Pomphorhynchus laevis]|nr:hypothetical protein GJ496_005114 [Pomphorhynchus laevis]